ncbi:MFS transporter [Rhodococcus sp. 06-621-2]|nr:MFS transporter [Rhodococcus sp. 06-621-2]
MVDRSRQATRYRYVVLTAVVFITVVNYVDRGAISYAASGIIDEYSLDPAAWGTVLGFFGYGYMFGALAGGFLADKKGPKWTLMTACIAWSVLVVCISFAGDFGLAVFGSAVAGFAVFRVGFGFAEGPMYATVNRTVANWSTPRERAFMSGFGLVGTPIGAILAAPIAVGLIALTGSWRWMFVILGALGILWLIWWIRNFTDRPADNDKVNAAELAVILEGAADTNPAVSESKAVRWFEFFLSRTLVCNAIGYFAFMYVSFMILTWTPRYLETEFGYELGSIWYLGMIPWVGAVFTVLLGGRLSDRILQRTQSLWRARSGLAMVSLGLTSICFISIPLFNDPIAILIVMAVGNAINSLANAVFWTVPIDTVPERSATFAGITHFFANAATIIAPTLTGFLVASYGFDSMFVATAVATAIGMVSMLFVRPGRFRASKVVAA